ncbi:MAG: endolytic transglycosylase MltG, partial [Oscillospiraceae bacterium]|nr:endolytic transglycosylase MltG [Oscillospiraceae bacterium]
MSDKFDDLHDTVGTGSEHDESWKHIFEEELDLPADLVGDGLDAHPLDREIEEGETFQIDDAFFAAEGDFDPLDVPADPLGEEVEFDEEEDFFSDADWDEYDEDADMEAFKAERRRRESAVVGARRRRTGLMGGFMYAAFVLGVGTILAFFAWMVVDDVLGLTKEEIPVEVTIPDDFTIYTVAEELHAQGLVNNPTIFIWFARMFNYDTRIQPGVYQVMPMDFRAMIGSMNQRTGEMIEVRVMIPEGRSMRETFEILEYNGVATVEALTYAAENATFSDFEFLDDVPMNTMNRLEGFLFPDTYIFFRHQNPEAVIRTMLRNFRGRMAQNDNEINDLVEASPFTLREILNIAAMIEKEIANREEAARISSVIHNRLDRDMILQIDATIQYILGDER